MCSLSVLWYTIHRLILPKSYRKRGITVENKEKLAVVICNFNNNNFNNDNFNNENDICRCIDSVLASNGFQTRGNKEHSLHELKIYVIDNASDNGSFQAITEKYGESVSCTRSGTDLGSCGGLNLGITRALSEGFRYICCLGEAVTAAPDALRSMLDFIVENPNVGLVGGKVYHRHMPHYIQQFGISIDFKHFRASTLYADTADSDDIPNEVYCDAVGACCMMVSADAVGKAGLMPEENFLYWDDTEWGYRIRQAGFEVAALGNAKFYHSASPLHRYDNTKVNYYMIRNCLHFFMKYTAPEKCAKMSLTILRSVFDSFYLHSMEQAHNMAQTDLSALFDALYGLEGQAPRSRILSNDESGLGFVNFFEEHEAVYMEDDDPFLEQVIRQINPEIIFLQQSAPGVITIIRCHSILRIRDFDYPLDFSGNVVYIDKAYHMLATKEDVVYVKNYETNLKLFLYAVQPMMLRRITELRGIEF